MILTNLSLPAIIDTMDFLRHASVNAIVDCFDRKVEREFFIEALSAAFNLNEYGRRAQLLHALLEGIVSENPLPVERLKEIQAELLAGTETHRVALHRKMELVAKMAYEGDPIH